MNKIKGPKLTTQTGKTITIRCDTAEQQQRISKFAREVVGVSVNTFILNTILTKIDNASKS